MQLVKDTIATAALILCIAGVLALGALIFGVWCLIGLLSTAWFMLGKLFAKEQDKRYGSRV